jgi:hypothetical protein
MKLFAFLTQRGETRPKTPARKTKLVLESLEDRYLPSGNAISGFVFQDLNNNGIMDPGEPPIANTPIELHNSANVVVGTTTTDANGFYSFTTDSTVDTSGKTQPFAVTFADAKTSNTQSQTVAQFNPALGILQSVEIQINGHITSDIKVENVDDVPTTVSGTVSGTVQLTGPHLSGSANMNPTTQSFNAGAFDGTVDFSGTSGQDLGAHTATGSSTITLTAPGDIAPYIGTGTVNLTELSQATSSATGGGNLVTQISSQGGAQITVIYHYLLDTSLKPGNYTIVETAEPPGFLDGKDSRNGVVIPGSVGHDSIPVTLGNTDAINNDFGELPPASLAGFIFVDLNNDGVKDPGEAGIANVQIRLTGVDDTGKRISLLTHTAADGSYNFGNLRPGTYAITVTQPRNFLHGKNSAGSLGGDTSRPNITSAIVVGVGDSGTDYNFGELVPVSPGGSGGGGTGGSGGISGKGSFIRR